MPESLLSLQRQEAFFIEMRRELLSIKFVILNERSDMKNLTFSEMLCRKYQKQSFRTRNGFSA